MLGSDPARGGRSFASGSGSCCRSPASRSCSRRARRCASTPATIRPRPVTRSSPSWASTSSATRASRTLSGGQRRRLDLALGIVGDPDLLFLDEPTTGFDPAARRAAWELVDRLCSRGKTVLLTTHYMDEAQQLADRVVVIARGRIVAEGPPDALAPSAGGTVSASGSPTESALEASRPDRRQRRARGCIETTASAARAPPLTTWAVGRGLEGPHGVDGRRSRTSTSSSRMELRRITERRSELLAAAGGSARRAGVLADAARGVLHVRVPARAAVHR